MQQRFLLQILLLAQHVSGIIMPIIWSSRVLYSGCCLWYFVLIKCKNNFVRFCGIRVLIFTFLQHKIPQAATTVQYS